MYSMAMILYVDFSLGNLIMMYVCEIIPCARFFKYSGENLNHLMLKFSFDEIW